MGVRVTQEVVEVIEERAPTVRTTQLVIETVEKRSPAARVTQYVVEAIERRSPTVRLTQAVIEVIRSSRIPTIYDLTVTDTVAVTDTIAHQLSVVNLSVISNIAVTTDIVSLRQVPNRYTGVLGTRSSRLGLITLGTGFVQSSSVIDLAVTSEITVTQTIDERNTNPRLTISSPITVSQTLSTSRDKSITVASPITVLQTVAFRNTVVRETVISPISVTPVIRVSGTINIGVTHNISANQTIAARNSIVRLSVTSSLNAAQGEVARNTNNRQYIVSMSHVDSISDQRNTQPRLSITTAVHVTPLLEFVNPNLFQIDTIQVTPTISFRNTNPRLAVQSNVVVSQILRKSPNEQSVQSDIRVFGDIPLVNIKFYVNPLNYTMFVFMRVTEGFTGGSSNRSMSVQSNIAVDQTIRSNFPIQSVSHLVNVVTAITGGASQRTLEIRDDIVVKETLTKANTIFPISITDHMYVDHTIVNITQVVPMEVVDNLTIEDAIVTRIVPIQRPRHLIFLTDTVAWRANPNRQSVTHGITISQGLRSSPNYQAVQSNVAVTQRLRQLEIEVFSRIDVSSRVNLNSSRLVIQQLPITQSVTANRVINRSVISSINVNSKAYPGRIYVRDIVQRLILPEGDYLLPVSFDPQPIVVPVVIGVILNAGIMTIRSQGKAIQLPPALLGDSIEAVGTMEVRKSMDGTAFSYIQKTDRHKLSYKWKLSHLKAYELRAFVKQNLSELLTMINWKGETWVVKITSNPFNFTNSGVWELDGEFTEVAMEFEGKKVGG